MWDGIWEVQFFTQGHYKLHLDTNIFTLQVVVLVPQEFVFGTRKMHCKFSNAPRPFFLFLCQF